MIATETDSSPIYSEKDNVNIRYPQLRALKDDSRIESINDMIKDYIFDGYKKQEPSDPDYNPDAVGDTEVVYYITMQTPELLSIVFEKHLRYYAAGRISNNYRDHYSSFSIVIDLVNVTRLDLSDFADISIPKEEPGPDLYYRILRSREVFYPGFEKVVVGSGTNCISEKVLESWISASIPSYQNFSGRSESLYSFFVTPDSLYYISCSSTALSGYLYEKILDDAGPYELPKG